jgi:chromosome segregation ATPase
VRVKNNPSDPEIHLKNLMARKGSLSALESSEMREQQRRDVLVNEIDTLQTELLRVQNEREHLAVKLKSDADMLQGKMKQSEGLQRMNELLNEKLQLAEQRISFLENSISDNATTHRQILQCKEDEIRDFQVRILEYEKTIQGKEEKISGMMENRIEEISSKYESELKQLKQCLEEAQREYMKVSVNLQQVERELSQERNSARVVMKDLEDTQSKVNDNLKDKIHQLQTEQNLILATVKRQGFVDHLLHATRGSPQHHSLYKQLHSLSSVASNLSPDLSGNQETSLPRPLTRNEKSSPRTNDSGSLHVTNNLHGFTGHASSPNVAQIQRPYTTEQMMAAIRELQNDVNQLYDDDDA